MKTKFKSQEQTNFNEFKLEIYSCETLDHGKGQSKLLLYGLYVQVIRIMDIQHILTSNSSKGCWIEQFGDLKVSLNIGTRTKKLVRQIQS